MNMRGYNLQGDTSIVSSVPSLKSSLVAYLIRNTLEVYTMESAFASDDTLMRRTGDDEDGENDSIGYRPPPPCSRSRCKHLHARPRNRFSMPLRQHMRL